MKLSPEPQSHLLPPTSGPFGPVGFESRRAPTLGRLSRSGLAPASSSLNSQGGSSVHRLRIVLQRPPPCRRAPPDLLPSLVEHLPAAPPGGLFTHPQHCPRACPLAIFTSRSRGADGVRGSSPALAAGPREKEPPWAWGCSPQGGLQPLPCPPSMPSSWGPSWWPQRFRRFRKSQLAAVGIGAGHAPIGASGRPAFCLLVPTRCFSPAP